MNKPKKVLIIKKKDPAAMTEPVSEPKSGYEVGYCKPPKHSQFKPGKSGNPKGKPKGAKHLSTIIKEEANAKIEIKEGGKVKKITKAQALVKSMIANGIKGDNKSASNALNMIGEIDAKTLEEKDIQESYSKEDLEALKSHVDMENLFKGQQDG